MYQAKYKKQKTKNIYTQKLLGTIFPSNSCVSGKVLKTQSAFEIKYVVRLVIEQNYQPSKTPCFRHE